MENKKIILLISVSSSFQPINLSFAPLTAITVTFRKSSSQLYYFGIEILAGGLLNAASYAASLLLESQKRF